MAQRPSSQVQVASPMPPSDSKVQVRISPTAGSIPITCVPVVVIGLSLSLASMVNRALMNFWFSAHSYVVFDLASLLSDSQEPMSQASDCRSARSVAVSPHSLSMATSHRPSWRTYREEYRLEDGGVSFALTVKVPSSRAVSLLRKRTESVLASAFTSERLL